MKHFELTNGKITARITNYGAIITHLIVPDREGVATDVVLGFDTPSDYQTTGNPFYYGACCGRVANRIAQGQFHLNGTDYQLAINNGPNHLHGGPGGFHTALFQASESKDQDGHHLTLTHTSKDGDEGYPGELTVTVKYSIPKSANEIRITYHATTSASTPINLTNHTYFNLNGADSEVNTHNHLLLLHAPQITPTNADGIPTGEITMVSGTAFDFLTEKEIGQDISSPEPQIQQGLGYDHNFLISENLDAQPESPTHYATVTSPLTGITMEALTDQPGFQFYTGNYLDGSQGKNSVPYPKHHGFCLETQNIPDSPNQQENFPFAKRALLNPGEEYKHTSVYRFLPFQG